MPNVSPCVPCCDVPVSVNVPGTEGADGSDGADGVNAYGMVTADFDVPAVGDTVTVSLDNGIWMVQGQHVVFDGPATFQVVTVNSATSVTLEFLGYADDVAVGTTISSGAGVSPAGTQPALSTISAYAAGTAYSFTATSALLNFGTTDPEITITSPGTWLIFARVRYDYNAATFAAVRTVTSKLRRTNNSAADLTNGSSAWKTEIITTLTYTAEIHVLAPVVYTTANSDDVIQLWGDVSVIPSAGTLDAVEAEIVALKIS